jgi:hypothetical protein
MGFKFALRLTLVAMALSVVVALASPTSANHTRYMVDDQRPEGSNPDGHTLRGINLPWIL